MTIESVQSNPIFDGHIGQLIDNLVPCVEQVRHDDHEQWHRRAVIHNVATNVLILISSEPILKKRIEAGLLKVVGAVYNLESGVVSIIET